MLPSQGLQWSLLKEDEVIPRILAMEGRRGRPPNSERQVAAEGGKGSRRRKGRPPNVGNPVVPEGPSPSEVKLLRKLEAQGQRRRRSAPVVHFGQRVELVVLLFLELSFLSAM